MAGLYVLAVCAACAHEAEPYSEPPPSESPSIVVPGDPTPRVLRIEVAAITSEPPRRFGTGAIVGSTVPSIARVSNCIEIGRDDMCTSHKCDGFARDAENPSQFTAGPLHVDVGGISVVLEPTIHGTYFSKTSEPIPEGPLAEIPVVVSADGRQIPAFRIETTFPPFGLLVVPGLDVVANDFANPLFVGAAHRNEDLALTIDPPDASVDVIVTGSASGFSDGCTIGMRCTVATHCVFPSGKPNIPAAIFRHYEPDTTMNVTLVTTRRVHERRADFDIEVVTQTSANRVRYLLH